MRDTPYRPRRRPSRIYNLSALLRSVDFVLERLEERRLLTSISDITSGTSHLFACACGGCSANPEEVPISMPESLEWQKDVARPLEDALKSAKRVAKPAPGLMVSDRHAVQQATAMMYASRLLELRPASLLDQPQAATSGLQLYGSEISSASSATGIIGQQPTGALTGKIVYVNAGHGYKSSSGTWTTDRPFLHNMVEDFGNHDQLNFYVDHLFNAGATVVPLRPVGYQTNEVIVDNMSLSSGDWVGAWNTSSSSIYYGNSGDLVPYRFATSSTTETAVARYRANIPQAGFYPVYGWAQHGGNRVADQLYRVHHSGGATEVKVNHRRVGNGWVYLGTYHFNAGQGGPGNTTGGYVEISNRSSEPGNVVIADAIRFGNGIGPSGRGRHDEAALYWAQVSRGQGVSTSAHGSGTVSAPPLWSAHMNREQDGHYTDRVFLSFHSNAGGGRGTMGLYNNATLFPGTATPNQFRWAQLVGKEVNDDLVAIGSPPLEHAWSNRGSNITYARSDFAFGEINNNSINNEFDATIQEIAFHDNQLDAELLRSAMVRDWTAAAVYQATVRYFAEPFVVTKSPLAFAPESPTNIKATVNPNGSITLNWDQPGVTSYGGHAATGYRIYTSTNGYGFDGGTFVSGVNNRTYTFSNLPAGQNAYYFQVVAVNAGGESKPSEVVGARPSGFGKSRVLVVNGFNRLERQQNPIQRDSTSNSTLVNFERVRPRLSNSFDYVIQAGDAIKSYSGATLGFDSVWNHAVRAGQVNLANYDAVIWLSGEQSTKDRTFNSTEQSAVTSYINGGGKLFVSGSEIGWDLVAQNNGASFFNNTLRASYVADNAGGYTASGAAGSIFAGVNITFDNGSQFYNVDFPDRIGATGGSTIAMNYTGTGSGGAAVQFSSGSQRVVMMGFPFETITTAANRNTVMARVLDFFNMAAPSATPSTPTLLAASDSGISSSDRITNFNNSSPAKALQFSVPGTVSGATVQILADGVVIGSATASGTTTVVTSNGTLALADGVRNFTARQTEPGKPQSAASSPLAITIDTTPPTVLTKLFNFETAQNVVFQLSENVGTAPGVADFTLRNLDTNQLVSSGHLAASYNARTRTVTYTWPGLPNGILPDANYRATLAKTNVKDVAGNVMENDAPLDLWFLQADANRDRVVNVLDFNLLVANFGQPNRTFSQANFNYDANVNVLDFNLLASQFGKGLAAAPSSAALTEAVAPAPEAAPASGHVLVASASSGASTTATTTKSEQDDEVSDLLA